MQRKIGIFDRYLAYGIPFENQLFLTCCLLALSEGFTVICVSNMPGVDVFHIRDEFVKYVWIVVIMIASFVIVLLFLNDYRWQRFACITISGITYLFIYLFIFVFLVLFWLEF